MKKIIIFISLISLLGLSACSNKKLYVISPQATNSPEPTKSVEKANPISTPTSIESQTPPVLKEQDVKSSIELVEKVINNFENITSYSYKTEVNGKVTAENNDIILDNNKKIKELVRTDGENLQKFKDGKVYFKKKSENIFQFNENATKIYQKTIDFESLNDLSLYINIMKDFKSDFNKYPLKQENNLYTIYEIENEGKIKWSINKEYQIVEMIYTKGETITKNHFFNYNKIKSIE